jgi:HEAT repeat protein
MMTSPTNASNNQAQEIKELIGKLKSEDGLERQSARYTLEGIGDPAVPFLTELLKDNNTHARWEAVKALDAIRPPSIAPVLVETLEDEDPGVRWLASEGLIALESLSIKPLLEALTSDLDSVWLREGAHHVLHELDKKHLLEPPVHKVFKALESTEPAVTVPWAAEKALEEIEIKKL